MCDLVNNSLISSSNLNLPNSNMIFKTFKAQSKKGGDQWAKKNRHLWKKRTITKIIQGNHGIPCGLVNKIVVVDMDLYKVAEGESDFIKRFGKDYINYFNTFFC